MSVAIRFIFRQAGEVQSEVTTGTFNSHRLQDSSSHHCSTHILKQAGQALPSSPMECTPAMFRNFSSCAALARSLTTRGLLDNVDAERSIPLLLPSSMPCALPHYAECIATISMNKCSEGCLHRVHSVTRCSARPDRIVSQVLIAHVAGVRTKLGLDLSTDFTQNQNVDPALRRNSD